MENRLTRLFKVTIAVFAILLLGVMGGFVTTVGADDTVNDYALITLKENTVLIVTPDGYKMRDGELIPHTGGYILTGRTNTDIEFKNGTDTDVVYNVILHEAVACSQTWHGCVGLDDKVTLNITAYGENKLVAYNHAGIKCDEAKNASVSITITEGAKLEVGSQYTAVNCGTFTSNINVTLTEGASSVDMTQENWATENQKVTFSNGELINHSFTFEKIDDETCKAYCDKCKLEVISYHEMSCVSRGLTEHVFECTLCDYVAQTEEHITDNGKCELCNESASLMHTSNENEIKYFFDFQEGIDYAMNNGGTLRVLRNYDEKNICINCENVDYTFDLNGHTVKGYFYIGSYSFKGTLTLTDTCQDEPGKIYNSGISCVIYGGTVIIEYVQMNNLIYAVNGNIVLKNLEQDELMVSADIDGKIQLIDCFIDEFKLGCSMSLKDTYSIKGGGFAKISIEDAQAGFTLSDVLHSGYAFFDEDENLVSANVHELYYVTVDEHTNHENEEIITRYDGSYHYDAYFCGQIIEESKEKHTIGENNKCAVCGYDIVVKVENGGTTEYFATIDAGFKCAIDMNAGKLTLLNNLSSSYAILIGDGEYILDLNGYTFTCKSYIDLYDGCKSFTVMDSSSNQSGKICDGYDGKGAVLYVYGAKLTIESGTIEGMIYIYSSVQMSEVVINGGTFIANENFCIYENSSVTINGGVFKTKEEFAIFEEGKSNVKIYGGTFENGIVLNNSSNNAPIFLKDIIPDVDECEIFFVDKNGDRITLDNEQESYEGYLRVSHQNGEMKSNETEHSEYCSSCDITYFIESHLDLRYVINQNDKSKHDAICEVCEYVVALESHTGGSANCTEYAICDYCEGEYGELSPDVHEGGKATCVSKAICEHCDKEYGELNESRHEAKETKYVQGDKADEHNKVYACCDEIIDTGKHENGVAGCVNKAVCTVCGLEYGNEPNGHKYDNNCDASCNECGEGRQISGHVYDNACDTECNECKATRETAHNYGADGNCLTCDGKTEPQEAPKSMGTGAIIGIIIASVAVFGGGAFSLIWFVLRKKF